MWTIYKHSFESFDSLYKTLLLTSLCHDTKTQKLALTRKSQKEAYGICYHQIIYNRRSRRCHGYLRRPSRHHANPHLNKARRTHTRLNRLRLVSFTRAFHRRRTLAEHLLRHVALHRPPTAPPRHFLVPWRPPLFFLRLISSPRSPLSSSLPFINPTFDGANLRR